MREIKKRGRKNLIPIIALISICLIVLVRAENIPSTAFYENFLDQNSLGEKAIGDMNSYGYFDYVQNIEVPKGVNNLKPSLGIKYNSQNNKNSNSFIGNGFEITQYYIEREINSTLSNISDDFFILNLGGVSYNLVFDSLNVNYHTEIETYLNIENISGGNNTLGNYWIVRTKDEIQELVIVNQESKEQSTILDNIVNFFKGLFGIN